MQQPQSAVSGTLIGKIDRAYSKTYTNLVGGTTHTGAATGSDNTLVYSGTAFNGQSGLYDVHSVASITNTANNLTHVITRDLYSASAPTNGDTYGTLVGDTLTGYQANSYRYVQRDVDTSTKTLQTFSYDSLNPSYVFSYTSKATWYPDGSGEEVDKYPYAATSALPAYTETDTMQLRPDGAGSDMIVSALPTFPPGSPPYETLQTWGTDGGTSIAYRLKTWQVPPTSAPPSSTSSASIPNWIPSKMRAPAALSSEETISQTLNAALPAWCTLPSGFPATGSETVTKYSYLYPTWGIIETETQTAYTAGNIDRACEINQASLKYYDPTTGQSQSVYDSTERLHITSTTFPVSAAARLSGAAGGIQTPEIRRNPEASIFAHCRSHGGSCSGILQ